MPLTDRQLNQLIEQKLRDGPRRSITKALIELRDARATLSKQKAAEAIRITADQLSPVPGHSK